MKFTSSLVFSETLHRSFINLGNWNNARVETRKGVTVLSCAAMCQYRESKSGNCNAFKFNNQSRSCEMAELTFLEDPGVGESPSVVMVSQSAAVLPMTCRGGERCCSVEQGRVCAEGEGDCDSDDQCEGLLECGQDNCATKSGGLWDSGDDCCHKRCASDRPCGPGDGPCVSDSECQTSGGYYICSTACTDRTYYPLSLYPRLAEIYGYTSSNRLL